MSTSALIAAFWVLAATGVAFLPMRRQMIPGLTLLILAPLLILYLGWQHGWWWVAIGLFGFASMFRNPLRYFWSRLNGGPRWNPAEDRE